MMTPPPTPLESALRAMADELRAMTLKYAAAVGNLTHVTQQLQERDREILELQSMIAELQPEATTTES